MTQFTQSDLLAIAGECYHDPEQYCKSFFPHVFTEPIPDMHRKILSIITRPLEKHTLLLVPGGFGKTTFAGLIAPSFNLVYQNYQFMAYIGISPGEGKTQMMNLRTEFDNNEKLKLIFGDMKSSNWNGNMVEAANGCAIASRGYGHQETIEKIRGMTWSGTKPQLIIVDSITSRTNVSTQKQREELKGWFFSEVMQALAPGGKILMFETLKHADSLPEDLKKDPLWDVHSFSALDEEGHPTWPYMAGTARLEELRKSFAMANQLHVFKMEFYNEPQSENSTGLMEEIALERDEFIAKLEPLTTPEVIAQVVENLIEAGRDA